MLTLTHNNHFKYGYNGNWFNERTSENDEWKVMYGTSTRKELNFHDECVETAKIIRDNTDLPITVCLSGGADSEVVVRAFYEAKIPIKVAILRFKNDLNVHDISYGVILCESLSIPYKFIDLDILKFWETDMWGMAEKYKVPMAEFLSTIWLMDQLDGYLVLGSGDCFLVNKQKLWYLIEKESVACWYRYFSYNYRIGCPGFFQYTSEIIYGFLNDDIISNMVNENKEQTSILTKYKVYKKYFNIIDRLKYTGFEKVNNYLNTNNLYLREKYKSYLNVYRSEYFSLKQAIKYGN